MLSWTILLHCYCSILRWWLCCRGSLWVQSSLYLCCIVSLWTRGLHALLYWMLSSRGPVGSEGTSHTVFSSWKICSVVLRSGIKIYLFLSYDLFCLMLQPVMFSAYFVIITNKANCAIVLTLLEVAFLWKSNYQWLGPSNRQFSYLPDLVADVERCINHVLSSCLN